MEPHPQVARDSTLWIWHNTRMFADKYWAGTPPHVSLVLHPYLLEVGSLTEKLMATGHEFAVRVLYQGPSIAATDEAGLVGVESCAPVTARHVALTLNGVCVVVARSITAPGCPIWEPILQRGRRSLGLTLFGQDKGIARGPLRFCEILPGQVLYPLARGQDLEETPRYAARRSNFIQGDAALNVCEVFLPVLETFL